MVPLYALVSTGIEIADSSRACSDKGVRPGLSILLADDTGIDLVSADLVDGIFLFDIIIIWRRAIYFAAELQLLSCALLWLQRLAMQCVIFHHIALASGHVISLASRILCFPFAVSCAYWCLGQALAGLRS